MSIEFFLDGVRKGYATVVQNHGESFEDAIRASIFEQYSVRIPPVHRFRSLGGFVWRSISSDSPSFRCYVVD